jgi:hypothetical protein
MVLQPATVPEHYARMKDTIRADMAVSPNLDRWVDDSSWMNLSHKKPHHASAAPPRKKKYARLQNQSAFDPPPARHVVIPPVIFIRTNYWAPQSGFQKEPVPREPAG